LRAVVAHCGLKYEEVDYFPDDVDALIVTTEEGSVAVVNKNQSITRRRFSLAHELGHFVLHRDGSVLEESVSIDSPPTGGDERTGTSIAEREANLFAGELLVPLELLKENFRPGMTAADVGKLFEVSESVAAIALSSHLRAIFKL
jgi:Zn-dependent peptidase ImmA (M78 family)